MIIIDGVSFDIGVEELKRTADFLDKYANRTEDGDLHRELIGVYFNYTLKFGAAKSPQEYARLWEKLTEPEEYHTVTVPDESGDYTFRAYFAGVADEMITQYSGKNYWGGLTVSFKAKAPARS